MDERADTKSPVGGAGRFAFKSVFPAGLRFLAARLFQRNVAMPTMRRQPKAADATPMTMGTVGTAPAVVSTAAPVGVACVDVGTSATELGTLVAVMTAEVELASDIPGIESSTSG